MNPAVSPLANDLGISGLPPASQNAILDKFCELILKRSVLEMFEKIPPERRSEFGALTNSGTDAALRDFMRAYVPDPDGLVKQIVAEEAAAFKSATAAA